jgi:hypothetical protein
MGTANLAYKTLFRLIENENGDNVVQSFSTQRRSYVILKENEYRTRVEAEEALMGTTVEEETYEAEMPDDDVDNGRDAFYGNVVEEDDHEDEDDRDEDFEEGMDDYCEDCEEEDDHEVQFIITQENVTVIIDGEDFVINKDFDQVGQLTTLLLEMNDLQNAGMDISAEVEEIIHLVDLATRIEEGTGDLVSVDSGEMEIDGERLPKGLAQGITKAVLSGRDDVAECLRNFWNKLKMNKSESARKNLFDFMSNNGMGIDKAGDVVCFKFVNANMTDCYTGTTKITLGEEVTMDRDEVMEDENVACGPGLHVGSKEYSYDGQSHVLVTSFDPQDAVSCPVDHSYQKLRVCRYMPVALTHDADLQNHTVIHF